MADNPECEDQLPVEELTPEEANRIIHSHRKVRYGKATRRTMLAFLRAPTVHVWDYRIVMQD